MYGTTTGYGQTRSYGMQTGYSIPTYSTIRGSYTERSYSKPYIMPEKPNNFETVAFLNPDRPRSQIIYCADDVMEMVKETFLRVTGTEFPKNGINITVLDRERFQKAHNQYGVWSEGIMGFSINRYGKGTSEVIVREDHVDQMMLTIGHEIGHVMSNTLPNPKDEEAKAHAFSLAWMEAIREYNIGGLQAHITPNPAQNGLHDVAFDFVKRLLHGGMSSKDIFDTLSKGLLSMIAEVSQ